MNRSISFILICQHYMSIWTWVKDIQYPDCTDKNVMMLTLLPDPHHWASYTVTLKTQQADIHRDSSLKNSTHSASDFLLCRMTDRFLHTFLKKECKISGCNSDLLKPMQDSSWILSKTGYKQTYFSPAIKGKIWNKFFFLHLLKRLFKILFTKTTVPVVVIF